MDTVSVKPRLPDPVRLYCPPGKNSLRSAQSGSYIPMASALASPRCPSSCQVYTTIPSQHTSRSTIYENCLQCRKGQDGCMLPKAVPPVIGSLSHPSEWKSTGGQGHFPFLQELSASFWGLSFEILPAEEPSHLPALTTQPPLQLGNKETVGGKGSTRSLSSIQTGHSYSLTKENKRALTPCLIYLWRSFLNIFFSFVFVSFWQSNKTPFPLTGCVPSSFLGLFFLPYACCFCPTHQPGPFHQFFLVRTCCLEVMDG